MASPDKLQAPSHLLVHQAALSQLPDVLKVAQARLAGIIGGKGAQLLALLQGRAEHESRGAAAGLHVIEALAYGQKRLFAEGRRLAGADPLGNLSEHAHREEAVAYLPGHPCQGLEACQRRPLLDCTAQPLKRCLQCPVAGPRGQSGAGVGSREL